jgi:signal transduction histidine kinase/DNA-binding NarL/FixJ family response regulator
MGQPLRALLIEDEPGDAELVLLELRRAGLEPEAERVDTAPAMHRALDRRPWQVIIADYNVPGFGGLEPLRIVQRRGLDLPFILVSGAIGEETAVEAMKAGAHDYVLKQSLTRLGAAVRRELREAELRRERRHAVEALGVLASRSTFLSEASRRLTLSLDYEDTLARATSAPVGEVADWCALSVVDDLRVRLRTAFRHVEAPLERRARRHLERWPLSLCAAGAAAEVIRTGRWRWTSPETALLTTAPHEERQALAQALGHRVGMCLPLVARGRILGAITLVSTSPERRLGDSEVGFAEELAGRAAMALDNATLYAQAQEGIRARDEFLSVASHELNTPLATLTLQIGEILREGLGPAAASERLMAGLQRTRRQVERLAWLARNLLDVSRLAAGSLPLCVADADLVAITREVVEQLAPELARSGCQVSVDAPAALVGRWDPLRVSQIVANLMSNAAKYGARAPIELALEQRDGVARLTVRDHGIGIAAAELDRVFGCFERAVSAQHYGGLGLGLYITRQVVEAHGGSIRVSSKVGVGSSFEVELPLDRPGLGASEAAHEPFAQADDPGR